MDSSLLHSKVRKSYEQRQLGLGLFRLSVNSYASTSVLALDTAAAACNHMELAAAAGAALLPSLKTLVVSGVPAAASGAAAAAAAAAAYGAAAAAAAPPIASLLDLTPNLEHLRFYSVCLGKPAEITETMSAIAQLRHLRRLEFCCIPNLDKLRGHAFHNEAFREGLAVLTTRLTQLQRLQLYNVREYMRFGGIEAVGAARSSSLQDLDLEGSVPMLRGAAALSSLTALTRLDFGDNRLGFASDEKAEFRPLARLKALRSLSFAGCLGMKMSHLSNLLRQLPVLETLSLHDISGLGEASSATGLERVLRSKADTLRHLDLGCNVDLFDTFSVLVVRDLTKLTALSLALSPGGFHALPSRALDVLRPLTGLQVLDLSHALDLSSQHMPCESEPCETSLIAALSGMQQLRVLNLGGSKIHGIQAVDIIRIGLRHLRGTLQQLSIAALCTPAGADGATLVWDALSPLTALQVLKVACLAGQGEDGRRWCDCVARGVQAMPSLLRLGAEPWKPAALAARYPDPLPSDFQL